MAVHHVLRGLSFAAGLFALGSMLGVSASAQRRVHDDTSPLQETERIRHLLSRFAFGAVPGAVEEVRVLGIEAWFERQLAAGSDAEPDPHPQALAESLANLPAWGMDLRTVLATYRDGPADARPKRSPDADLRDAVLLQAIYAKAQVREVAADFFRNHFNVDTDKDPVASLAVDWERRVIRAEALGEFGAMLQKTAQHPAMLLYLDNAVSRRPPSKAELREVEVRVRLRSKSKDRGREAAQIASQLGLNENYARELLELHTLGVDRHYSQRDVVEVARVLTGWTTQLDSKQEVGFRFDPNMHARGEKYVLGTSIRASSANPVDEGRELLAMLAAHRGTADFLAWKLCRFFVADDPPAALVERTAEVFRRSKGDHRAVLRAIVRDPEFFAPRHFQTKFKRPFEFVVSALRVTGAAVNDPAAIHRVLEQLSEPIYRCEDPTGYYDQAEAWRDPGVMAVRWRFAMDLAAGKVQGVKVPDEFYAGLHPRIPRAWRDQLAERILPAGMSERTAAVLDARIQRHLEADPKPQPAVLGALIVGLLLGCPEFQRQ